MIKNNKRLSGMTFVEMIMAIAIFTVGIAGFSLLFIKTWKNNSHIIELGNSSLAASQGLNKTVDYIRRARQGDDGAYAIQSANDNDLVIFCDYNKDGITERIHLYKNGENILMGITLPTETLPKTYPTGDQSVITLASYVVNEADEFIFSYYNADYPADTTSNPMPTPAYVSNVRLVKVNLKVNSNPLKFKDDINLHSFVEMRNLNDYNNIE